jgi:isopenicillin N synthase-like dioxygenase
MQAGRERNMMTSSLPVIDMSPLLARGESPAKLKVAREIESACRDSGFFYATGHGIASDLFACLDSASGKLFELPEAEKLDIRMSRGGRAWRGYFAVGGELTSGKADLKEGIYFGTELPADHPRVRAGVPLHGANLFPPQVPELRNAVLDYLAAATITAHALMEGIALSLRLEPDYFHRNYTANPTVLFRIFHYPPALKASEDWGVGEHTDYGLLTLLAQDELGGLQVKTQRGWIEAHPIPGTLVCNVGDMLDRLTGGRYRSTPHRVRNLSGQNRMSFPFFFDPDFDAEIRPLPAFATDIQDDHDTRWDKASVHAFKGTYGDYLLSKVSKVFPDLKREVISKD